MTRKEQIADALLEYLKDNPDLSQRQLSDRIGVSPSHVTHMKKKAFDETSSSGSLMLGDNIIKKFERFFYGHTSVWDIDNYTICTNVFIEAMTNHEQRIIDGPKGSGKSYAAEMFSKEYPKHTYYIRCATDMTAKQFMVEMAKVVGVNHYGSRYELRVRIAEKLLNEASPLLIIDEAENAKDAAFGSIKDLYDYKNLYQSVGIVVIGANEFMEWLRKKAMARSPKCFPQFLSRFSAEPGRLNAMGKKDIKEVSKLYSITYSESLDWLWANSRDFRELDRNIKRLLNDRKLNEAA